MKFQYYTKFKSKDIDKKSFEEQAYNLTFNVQYTMCIRGPNEIGVRISKGRSSSMNSIVFHPLTFSKSHSLQTFFVLPYIIKDICYRTFFVFRCVKSSMMLLNLFTFVRFSVHNSLSPRVHFSFYIFRA